MLIFLLKKIIVYTYLNENSSRNPKSVASQMYMYMCMTQVYIDYYGYNIEKVYVTISDLVRNKTNTKSMNCED